MPLQAACVPVGNPLAGCPHTGKYSRGTPSDRVWRGEDQPRRDAKAIPAWFAWEKPQAELPAQLDLYWTIDGAVGGTGAELINHSCEPNLKLRKFRGHLWLFSVRRIRPGEELGYDYGFSETGRRVCCRCGSAKCRGTINRT